VFILHRAPVIQFVPPTYCDTVFGFEHPDSSSNLLRRAKRRAEKSSEYQKTNTLLETKLALKTENQV